MNVIGLIVLLVFYALILVVGVIAAKKFNLGYGRKSELSMLAGRRLGTIVGVFTMTATIVGGGYVNGTAESVAQFGLLWTMTPACIFIGLVVGGLVYAKRMRDKCYVTMLDPFQEQFGDVVTVLIYLATVCGDVFWTASILSALGSSVSVVINLHITIAILGSASVTTVYTLIGQMVSVAYTDIIQLIFIVTGLVLSLPFILTNDKVGDITSTSDQWLGDLHSTHIASWIDLLMAMIFGTIPWQSYFQRVLSVKSGKDAQMFSIIAAGFGLLLAVPSVLIGAAGVTADWGNTTLGESPLEVNQSSLILPHVVNEFTPKTVSVLALGAVCAAVMSSMDSSILGSSSMFSHNIVRNIIMKKAGDTFVLWIQRASVLFIASISTVIALFVTTIYGMFILAADIVFVVVLPQLTCALFIPFSNSYGSLLGYIVGLFLRLGAGEPIISLPTLIKYPFYDHETNSQLFPYRSFAFVCSFLTVVILSPIFQLLFENYLPSTFDILGVVNRKKRHDEEIVLKNMKIYVEDDSNQKVLQSSVTM